MIELAVGILLAAGALYYVLEPVLRPGVGGGGARGDGDAADSAEGDDPEDDLSPQAVALRALREIEFDRATGKLSDADYDALHARYQAAALATLRGDGGEGTVEGVRRAPSPRPSSPVPRPTCPADGPRPEHDPVFCSACGRRLQTAPGYCARCGTALEADATYCARCGARVAA